VLAAVGSACRAPGVEVRDVRAFEASRGGTGAFYATIVNATDSADQIDSLTSPASPVVSAHDSREVNGLVTMVPLEHPAIPAHDSLVFAPGGAHLMLEGLTRDLKSGDSLQVTLWLRRSGPRTVTAVVRPYGS
jgi:copper(I)-binding protein